MHLKKFNMSFSTPVAMSFLCVFAFVAWCHSIPINTTYFNLKLNITEDNITEDNNDLKNKLHPYN